MKLFNILFISILITALSCTDRKVRLTSLETEVDTTTIRFEYAKLSNALIKAKESNRLILTYVASPYCKRCKQMQRDVFTDTLVTRFINENFICAKFYLKKTSASSKSKEFKQLNKSLIDFMDIYNCKLSYPTFVILNADGNLIKKASGSMTVQELIDFGNGSLTQSTN